MKPRILLVFVLSVATCAGALAQISTPKARADTVAAAAKLAVWAPVAPGAVEVEVDPFHPPKKNLTWEVVERTDAPARNDADLVKALIKQIQPTGSGEERGGVPILYFGERRQKIGDILRVSLDGVEYSVEIVSITPTRFRIRYNGQEAEQNTK